MTQTPQPATAVMHAAPTRAATGTDLDLDTQIEQLEQRLVAREAWIQATAGSLARRAQHAVTPRPWVLPVVGAGVVMWLGWRLWHRHDRVRPVHVALPAQVVTREVSGLTDWPWAGLAASGWPLLPVAWRGRVSPASAAAIVSTVVAVVRRLGRRR